MGIWSFHLQNCLRGAFVVHSKRDIENQFWSQSNMCLALHLEPKHFFGTANALPNSPLAKRE